MGYQVKSSNNLSWVQTPTTGKIIAKELDYTLPQATTERGHTDKEQSCSYGRNWATIAGAQVSKQPISSRIR